MTVTKLIALHGLSGAGKSTFADILSVNHGYLVVPFAYPLRQEVYEKLSLPEQRMGDKTYELGTMVEGKTVQQWLLDWGAMRRKEDPDYWVNLWLQDYECYWQTKRQEYSLVVPDLRQPNELEMLQSQGAYTVQIIRSDRDRPVQPLDQLLPIEELDATIYNDGSLDDLEMLAFAIDKFVLES